MIEYTDLEIGLHRREAQTYAVELRVNQPDSQADTLHTGTAHFDFDALRRDHLKPAAYGQRLFQNLFADDAVREAFRKAQSDERPLRVRLFIGPSAPELHTLRWETLRDPEANAPLFTGERLLFSRYLGSPDWRPVRLRPASGLSALVVVADPSDVTDYEGLAPLAVESEINRARASLGEKILMTALPDPGVNARATLTDLIARLRQGGHDVLYLVCHGLMAQGKPVLLLEDDAGKGVEVAGQELVTRLNELQERPRLVVLASCQSAGDGLGEALTALGPRLAEAGIPAVVAMQGKVGLETIAKFFPVFFEELQQHGQIDRAMAVARGAVRELPDYWMPALFMRLKSGRIWYEPGFSGGEQDFEKWEGLAGSVRERTCTPILGYGLLEPLLGAAREIAQNWTERYGYPMAPSDQDDLPRVAQYMETRYNPRYLRQALRESVRREMLRRHGAAVPADLRPAKDWTAEQLLQALSAVGRQRRQQDPAEPHRLLAQLRLPLYLTANPDNLLAEALAEANCEPQVRLCPWDPQIPQAKSTYDETPTPDRPLVYHLFGHLSEPYSVVLTEDEYFDYLIGVARNKDLIPEAVRAALVDSDLLFLGFQVDDWNFRVLLRSLMAQEGSELGKLRHSHIAAQIEPDEDRLRDPRRARRYLEKYFESEKISLYWGSLEDFLKTLQQHLAPASEASAA